MLEMRRQRDIELRSAGTKPVSTFIANNTKLVNLENEKLAAMIQSGRTIFPYVGVHDAPRMTRNVFFVGHDDKRVALRIQLLEQVHDLDAGL